MKQPKPFQLNKRPPLFGMFRTVIMKPFYPRPQITCLGKLTGPAIFVSNHEAKRGPVVSELYFPVRTAKWGAYQMLCDYNTRRKYLRDVFYRQKQGMGRFKSAFKAFFEAFFSLYVYRGMNFLPVFPDARLTKTLSYSADALSNGVSVWVFPEDSGGGYDELMGKFFPGFVMLAESYFRKTGVDVPVYPVYYHSKYKKLVVGEPRYVHALKQQGLSREEIAAVLCSDVNSLFLNHIKK